MGEILLKMEQISLFLGQRRLLHDINLEIAAGEIVTLIGPNGAGKTSLLRVALGLHPPSRGSLWRQSGLRIGYMPQKLHLDTSLPLRVRRFLTLSGEKNPQRLQQQMAEVGAASLYDSFMSNLSGGEFQRVLLARALLRKPQLLVLDEPVQGVDVNGQAELYRLIGELRQRHGCAVLMVSHDLHLVMAATDRVLCLNGHICCSGAPQQVTGDPAFRELFGPQVVGQLALYNHHRHEKCRNCEENLHVR